MVEKSFYIKGENIGIFDFGLRAGLIGKAGDQNIKLHTTIMPDDENQVRVTPSGSYGNVTNFYEYIKNNDVRAEKANVMYKVGQMLDCNAAEINFTNYHESFAIEQQGKTCVIAQKMLSSLKGAENVGIYPAQGSNVP